MADLTRHMFINKPKRRERLIVEPWCHHCALEPNTTIEFRLDGGIAVSPLTIQFCPEDDVVIVFLDAGYEPTLTCNGVELKQLPN